MCLKAKTKTQTGGGELTDKGKSKLYIADARKHKWTKKKKKATEYYEHVFLLLLNMEGCKDSTINHIKPIVLFMLLRAMLPGTTSVP